MNQDKVNYPASRSGLLRRLAALFYDALIMAAVLLVASALALPVTHGRDPAATGPWLSAYLLLVCFAFCGWFWTHGGQTLGLRAWRAKLCRDDGSAVDWTASLVRFIAGIPAWVVVVAGILQSAAPQRLAGLTNLHWLSAAPSGFWLVIGFGWLAWDHSPWSLRDRLSRTAVFTLPRTLPGVRSRDAPEQ